MIEACKLHQALLFADLREQVEQHRKDETQMRKLQALESEERKNEVLHSFLSRDEQQQQQQQGYGGGGNIHSTIEVITIVVIIVLFCNVVTDSYYDRAVKSVWFLQRGKPCW